MSEDHDWQRMSADEIDAMFTHDELRRLLAGQPYGLRSAAYFLKKAELIRYLRSGQQVRAEIHAHALPKVAAHTERNRRNRRRSLKERVLVHTEGGSYRFIGAWKDDEDSHDEFTGRPARMVCLIEGREGEQFRVNRHTAAVLKDARRLTGYAGSRSVGRSKRGAAAHRAGERTANDLFRAA